MRALPPLVRPLCLFALLAVPALGYSANSPLLWSTPLTGASSYPSTAAACVATWQAHLTPYLCPADENYCWTSGGPNPSNTKCTSVCTGSACAGYSFCSSAAAECGYEGNTLIATCPGGHAPDKLTGLCIDPSLAKSNGGTCPSTLNPIAFGTGNKWLIENDLSQGQPLAFTRTYNSNPGTLSGALGAGWRIEYGQRLGFNSATGAVWAYRPDGRALQFLVSGSSYVADADVSDRLYREATSGYRLEANNRIERYDNAGRLTGLTDSQGRTHTFTYDVQKRLATIADHVGRQLVLSYDTQSRISAVTDPVGQKVIYAYDTANNLSKVTYPDLKFKTYHYNEPANTGGADLPHALTGITDENGIRYMSYRYDSNGRAIEEISPAVGTNTNHYQLAYNTGSTTVTDPLGTSRAYNFETVLGVPRATGSDQPAGSGCGPAASAATYDANGNVASRTDFSGKVTTYIHDGTRNLETQRVEASGTANARTISSEWHNVWRLPTRIAEPKKLLSYVYNGDIGDGQSVTCAPANATIPMGGTNQKIGVLCSQNEQATTDASGAWGLSPTIDTAVVPRIQSYTYDAAGRVLTDTDPRGGVTTRSYYGTTTFPSEPFDPHMNAVTLLLHGDGLQGATSFVDSSLSSKALTYSGAPQISTAQSKFGPSSIVLNGSSYLSVPDPAFLNLGSADFTMEAWVHPTSVFASYGGSRFAIIAGKDTGTPGAGRSWWLRLYSDATSILYIQMAITGNGSSFEASTGVASGAAAIPLNQWSHIAATRSGGFLRTFVNGILVNQTASSAVVQSSATPVTIGGEAIASSEAYFPGYIDDLRVTTGVARYTANFTPPTQAFPDTDIATPRPNAVGQRVGDLQSITNPAGHVTRFNLYDLAGRVRQMTDPKGVVTDITYTSRGWVGTVTVTPPGAGARVTTYTYDNIGQLTGATLPDGTTLGYSYDAAHRLIDVTDAKGNTVTYTLDAAGNRTGEQVKDPSGTLQRNITRVYDALNRVQQVTGASN